MDDGSYFIRRAEEEALAAAQAGCERARRAHRDLAERYRSFGLQLEIYDLEPELTLGETGMIAVPAADVDGDPLN